MSEESTLPYDYKYCECGCGESIPKINRMRKTARYKHGHNMKGENNNFWKGGRHMTKAGYITISGYHSHPRNHGGRVLEHILVMEKYLGRYLKPSEVMHHINGIKTDNRLENLKLFTSHSEHMKLEKIGSKLSCETKRKIGLFHKGKILSLETRKKISDGHKRR